jgi:tetratricopeptide (TPR) repeat protein
MVKADDSAPSPPGTLANVPSSTALTARPDFTELLVLLKNAKNGCWVFALYNNLAAREEVVAAIKRITQPLPVFAWTYSPDQPIPTSYLRDLTPAQQNANAVVFFFDLERGGDAAWKSLDYYREALSDQPHSIVIWVTQAGRIAAARKAPHFWAQRSMVFDFSLTNLKQHIDLMMSWASRDLIITDQEDALRQQRIYQGLIADYTNLPDAPKTYLADLHFKLGQVSDYLYSYDRALDSYTNALRYYQQDDDRLGQAKAYKSLGDVQYFRKELEAAMASYEHALMLFQVMGDRLGQANVLRAIGDIQSFRNELEAAKVSYEHALMLFEVIGDRLGQANVLQAIGDTQSFRNELEAAKASYEHALMLFEAIGAKLGQANVGLALARAAHNRAQYEEAMRLYEQMEDRYGLARAKYFYALFLLDLGEPEKAKALLLEAHDTFALLNFEAGTIAIDSILQQLP